MPHVERFGREQYVGSPLGICHRGGDNKFAVRILVTIPPAGSSLSEHPGKTIAGNASAHMARIKRLLFILYGLIMVSY